MSDKKKLILKYLINHSLGINQISKLLGYKPFRFKKYLESNADPDIKLFWSLFSILGVKPEQMGIDDVVLDLSNNSLIKTEHAPPYELLSFSDWSNSELQSGEEFSVKYFDEIRKKVTLTENSLLIYDYMLNKPTENQNDLRTYFSGYKMYLKAIEELSFKNNITYKRILALPLHYEKLLSKLDLKFKTSFERSALSLLFSDSFEHILNSFDKFEDRFELYTTSEPSRNYSVMIIDSEYLLTENYRIRKGADKKCVPDLLFIEKCIVGSNAKKLLEIYQSDFRKIINKRISKEDFGFLIQTRFKDIKNEFERLSDFSPSEETSLLSLKWLYEKAESNLKLFNDRNKNKF